MYIVFYIKLEHSFFIKIWFMELIFCLQFNLQFIWIFIKIFGVGSSYTSMILQKIYNNIEKPFNYFINS